MTELQVLFLCHCCYLKKPAGSLPTGIWYRMSFKGSYSIRPNSSPSDNIAAQIPTADNQRHLWILYFFFLGVGLCLFLPGLSHIFVGHAPLSPAAVWVSVSSAHVFWARARRDAGQSLPLWFSVMHSLTRHSRRISLHPHILAFFFFFLSFLAFFARRATHRKISGRHR